MMLYLCVGGSAVRNVDNGARFWGWCVREEGWLVRGGWCVRGVDDNRKVGELAWTREQKGRTSRASLRGARPRQRKGAFII